MLANHAKSVRVRAIVTGLERLEVAERQREEEARGHGVLHVVATIRHAGGISKGDSRCIHLDGRAATCGARAITRAG